jgi:hypothetical protein
MNIFTSATPASPFSIKPQFYALLTKDRANPACHEGEDMAMMQVLIAETRDCSHIQSQLITSSYEEAWRAIESYAKITDKRLNMSALGKSLLDAIIEEMDLYSDKQALAEISLRRLGFWPSRNGNELLIA